jgi:hypothetical protein
MKVKLKEKHFDVWWKRDMVADVEHGCNLVRTSCMVGEIDEKGDSKSEVFNIVTGRTLQGYKDVNVKKVGRRISLARALSSHGFDRNERIVFWKKYLTSCSI